MTKKLTEDLALLRDLVLPAGAFLLRQQGEIGKIDYKSATEMVTDIDREAERRLLADLEATFPQDALRAEEGGGRVGDSDRTWHIDPLDGTTNYVHGYPFFSVSLGCATSQDIQLAAVYAPYLDELYLAAAGCGAVLERPGMGTRLELTRRVPVILPRALLGTGFPYVRDEVVTRNTEYVRRFLLAGCHGVRRAGSAAIDLCHVAAGKLDGYWEMKLKPWDVMAGTLLVREAGGVVTDFAAREGVPDGDSIIAAAPDLHDEMLAILREE